MRACAFVRARDNHQPAPSSLRAAPARSPTGAAQRHAIARDAHVAAAVVVDARVVQDSEAFRRERFNRLRRAARPVRVQNLRVRHRRTSSRPPPRSPSRRPSPSRASCSGAYRPADCRRGPWANLVSSSSSVGFSVGIGVHLSKFLDGPVSQRVSTSVGVGIGIGAALGAAVGV